MKPLFQFEGRLELPLFFGSALLEHWGDLDFSDIVLGKGRLVRSKFYTLSYCYSCCLRKRIIKVSVKLRWNRRIFEANSQKRGLHSLVRRIGRRINIGRTLSP
jgi:hypothetical protein